MEPPVPTHPLVSSQTPPRTCPWPTAHPTADGRHVPQPRSHPADDLGGVQLVLELSSQLGEVLPADSPAAVAGQRPVCLQQRLLPRGHAQEAAQPPWALLARQLLQHRPGEEDTLRNREP